MPKFKRYTMVIRRDENGYATPALKVRQKGDILKFDEVKELLKIASNIDCPECAKCGHGNVAVKCEINADPGSNYCDMMRYEDNIDA